jgi:phosphatidylinositol glycan class O
MENNEVFTPLSDITGPNSAPKVQKPTQQLQQQAAQTPRAAIQDPDKAKRAGQVHFKAAHGIIVAFFTFILYAQLLCTSRASRLTCPRILHVLGIYLFTSGFLLTRLVLDHKSECAVPPIDSAKAYTAGDAEKGCWHPKTFNKAVVIIVDALRYDFTVPFEAQFEPVDLAAAAANPSQAPPVAPHHFHNAFPVLYETAKNEPNNAFLLPFIADAPTATMQRLKGLTTGTLPTFIDLGSNFAGQAIDEDNLVAQLKGAGKRLVHLGDDTWHALFPDHFEPNLTHAYDSFNVWDLHTVDNGVTEHIFPLLKAENASKWDVIFGHYLGVDHAGHRYGPDHPAMTAKLNQMDDVFRRMIAEIDDDTLLVVMGDHGMDGKGDHGGESDDEIQAALWMYSKKGIFGRSDPAYVTPPAHAKTRPVGQIDLVPTLSLLLGMPIPFNNLGKPIEEAFIGKNGADYENLATVNRLTAAQIHTYQHEYAKVQGIADSARSSSLALWAGANSVWTSLGKSKANSEQMRQAYETFGAYQSDTLRICRDLWARFDVPRMLSGVTILASSLVIVALYARILHGDRADVTPVFFTRGAIGLVLGGIVGVGLTVFMPEDARSHVVIVSSAMSGVIGCGSTFYLLRYRLMPPMPTSIWGWTSLVFTLALSAGFAANSFTIWEDEILLHFLTTFGLIAIISSFRQKRVADRTLGVYHSILFTVLLRIASFSRLCREEQMPYCKSTYYASALSTTSAPWQLVIPAAAAILIPTFIKSYYEGTKSYQHYATMWIGLALRFGLMLSAAYWTLDAADDGEWLPGWENIIRITKRFLAQIVLAISMAFGYSIYNWCQPLLNVVINKDATDANGAPKEAVTIFGFANAHGSRYTLLVTIWYLAVAVLQKPMGAGAIGILVWQLFSLFEIIDTNNLRHSSIGPVVLGLLGSFHFFKTGHQATISSIQWESAFIPLAKIRYPWTPIIVVLNTFGAQILCAVAVPALVLWKVKPQKKGLLNMLAKAVATHILFYATINLATTMWAGHLRRHLMLYRIFSPRFMVGAVVLVVVDVVCIAISLWGARMSILSNAEVFGFGG